MDANTKKMAPRIIPHEIYVRTAKDSDSTVAAATVNWMNQTSFEPPLVAMGVKTDPGANDTHKNRVTSL